MVSTMPNIFKISVRGGCPTRTRTETIMRHHKLVLDEPPQRNGTDLGPTPLETTLAAYLGCTNVIGNILAEEMGIEIKTMSFELIGHFDTRGVFNKAAVTVPFPIIELTVNIVTSAGLERVEALKKALSQRCPVSVILRQAGCKIVETWNIQS